MASVASPAIRAGHGGWRKVFSLRLSGYSLRFHFRSVLRAGWLDAGRESDLTGIAGTYTRRFLTDCFGIDRVNVDRSITSQESSPKEFYEASR